MENLHCCGCPPPQERKRQFSCHLFLCVCLCSPQWRSRTCQQGALGSTGCLTDQISPVCHKHISPLSGPCPQRLTRILKWLNIVIKEGRISSPTWWHPVRRVEPPCWSCSVCWASSCWWMFHYCCHSRRGRVCPERHWISAPDISTWPDVKKGKF